MVCGDVEMVKSRPSMAAGFALSVMLVLTGAQGSNPGKSSSSQKNVTLIIHTTDERENVVALLLDSNFNQRNVLAQEQQMAAELISLFEKENAARAADATRAGLPASCRKVALLIAIIAFL